MVKMDGKPTKVYLYFTKRKWKKGFTTIKHCIKTVQHCLNIYGHTRRKPVNLWLNGKFEKQQHLKETTKLCGLYLQENFET